MKSLTWQPLHQPLAGGLVLRTPAGWADVDRVAAFNQTIHGPGALAELTRVQLAAYPHTQPSDLFFVEDPATGAVVSSIFLVPWQIRIGPVVVPVAEMGLVGTAQEYRGRGLVRAQVACFQQRMRARGCLISLIQGIPFFYRQFGYTYALPLEGGLRLSGRELPPPASHPFTFRRAAARDLPVLDHCYRQGAATLDLAAVRSRRLWSYLLGPLQTTELSGALWLVEEAGQPLGYLRLPDNHFGSELTLSEASPLPADAVLPVLHQLVDWAKEQNLPGVRLSLADNHLLARSARALGAHDLGRYAWQVWAPDLAALLATLAPALEVRLAQSALARWSGELAINFFRSGALLRVDAGRIQVTAIPGARRAPTSFPPDAFLPVLLGWRSVDEVRSLYPDAAVEGQLRVLFDTLFPRLVGHLYTCTA